MNSANSEKFKKTELQEVIYKNQDLHTKILDENYVVFNKIIGQGISSKVYLGCNLQTKQPIAVKRVKITYFSENNTIRLVRQISILKQLCHPNVVKLKKIVNKVQGERSIYMLFDYSPLNLRHLLNSKRHILQKKTKRIMFQILCGLAYCHSLQIVHRDIKPQNILISQNLDDVKLCDFGLARIISSSNSTMSKLQNLPNEKNQLNLTTHVVTRWYRAPQIILLLTNYTNKIDIWSAGCIFAELINKAPENSPNYEKGAPFPGKGCYPLSPPKLNKVQYNKINGFLHSDNDQLSRILQIVGTSENIDFLEGASENSKKYFNSYQRKKKIPFKLLYQKIDDDAIDLLEKLLAINPNQRISAQQALKHNYFRQIQNEFLPNTEFLLQPNNQNIYIEQDINSVDAFQQFLASNSKKQTDTKS